MCGAALRPRGIGDPAARGGLRGGRGHTASLRCSSCPRTAPKSEAIRRFQCEGLVGAPSLRGIRLASVYLTFRFPKLGVRGACCVLSAVRGRIVHVRGKECCPRAGPKDGAVKRSQVGTMGGTPSQRGLRLASAYATCMPALARR